MRPQLFALLLLVFGLSSCFDFEPQPNAIIYKNETYGLSDLLLEDWGDHSAEHYNYDFTFVGSSALFEKMRTPGGNDLIFLTDTADWFVFTEFFAPDTKRFLPGTYHELGNREIKEIGAEEFIFRKIVFGRTNRSSIEGTAGTIKITQLEADRYRFDYEVTLDNDLKLELHYEGAAVYVDRRN